MKTLLPVFLLLTTTICNAEAWSYTGSSTQFIPTSQHLGVDWSRSLIRTVDKETELGGLIQSTGTIDLGPTSNYELFRRKNKVREFSELEYYFNDPVLGKQVYQLVILVFEDLDSLDSYWRRSHPENPEQSVFSAMINASQICIFRLQDIYVQVSSKASIAECERISGMVFNLIQDKKNESSPTGGGTPASSRSSP